MSTMEQVEDNLHTFGNFEPLSQEEAALVSQVADAIKKRTKNGCTGCAYCMPCPQSISIRENLETAARELNALKEVAHS